MATQPNSNTIRDGTTVSPLGFLQEATEVQNSAILFNTWIQLEGLLEGSGIGFCLVCTGYLDFGVIGVVLVSILLGGMLRLAYREATLGILGLIFYANFIPIAMTSLRQDMAQIVSTPIKQLIIPLLIVWIVRNLGLSPTRPTST